MANYHVSGKRGDYTVKREGASRAADVGVGTKREAERLAKDYSKASGGGEVRFHDPATGRITDSDTVKPGNDPFPPRDKVH